jgi:hypothetical protein
MNLRRVKRPKEKKKRNILGYNNPVQYWQYNIGNESYSQAGETQEIAKAGRNGPS